jgi:hypothetical protein
LIWAAVCLPSACGSSGDFRSSPGKAGAGSGGSAAGSGGSAGSSSGSAGAPDSGGSAGSAGEDAEGGTSGAIGTSGEGGTSGVSGSSGTGGTGGSSGSSGTGGTSGASGEGGEPGTDEGITIVQESETFVSTVAVPELSLPAAPHAGHAIIVGVTCISDYMADCVIPPGGVTDTGSNEYTRIVQGEPLPSSAQAARGYLFIAENVAVASGAFVISVAPDGASAQQLVTWGAIEVAGLAPSPSVDATGSSVPGAEMSTTASTDVSTDQPDELAVALLSMRSQDTNLLIEPESGWTSHHTHQNGASGPPGHSLVSRLLTTTGIVTHTWTHDAPTRSAAGVIATFRGARRN